jgi:hypothetical protein
VDGYDLPLYLHFLHLVENALEMFQVALKERDFVMASLRFMYFQPERIEEKCLQDHIPTR